MKKINKLIQNSNNNENTLNLKSTDKNVYNLNHNEKSISQVIANSGWYNVKAYKPTSVQKSADPERNNVLIAPYLFNFNDLKLDESQLKNIDFIVEVKTNNNLSVIGYKQWASTTYELSSDAYKIYVPDLVWQGSIPGLAPAEDIGDYTIPYKALSWTANYHHDVYARNVSGNMRAIDGYYIYDDGDSHQVFFYMRKFTTITTDSATGYGYFVDRNVDTGITTYEYKDFSITYSEMSTLKFACGLNLWEYFELDDVSDLSFSINTTYRGYYDSNYFWPIVYSTTLHKLLELPRNNYNIYTSFNFPTSYAPVPALPTSLRLTLREDLEIISDDTVSYTGVSATGKSFFYVKNGADQYNLRIVGGIVLTTDIATSDSTSVNVTQENYSSDGNQYTYDNTTVIDTVDTPYYLPLEQDVQIRCQVIYNPKIKYNSLKSS